MSVRAARPTDWPAVRDLLIELGRPDVRDDDEAHRARFEAYLGRGDVRAFVAHRDGAVLGFINVEFRQRLHFGAEQAWVPDLIVAAAARGTGLGAALLARAEEAAREHGCWGITLESATWRQGAHAFYRAHGWADTGLSFTEPLDGTPWPPAPR